MIKVRPFLLARKVSSQVHWSRLRPLGGFPWPCPSGCPGRGCGAASDHLGAVSAYQAEPSVSQAQASFLSSSVYHRSSPEAVGVSARRRQLSGSGDHGIWATSLCNLSLCGLLVALLFNDGALLCTSDFMADGSGNTQVLVGSSGYTVTCWPLVKPSVCPQAQ